MDLAEAGPRMLFATGIRAALLDLRPWYTEPAAKTIGPASAAATQAITERALAKATLDRDDFEAASCAPRRCGC